MLSPTYYLQTVISPKFGGNLIADRKLFFLYIEKFVDSYFAQKFGGMTIPMTTSEKSCNEQDQEPASIIKKWPNIKNDKKWPDTSKVIFFLFDICLFFEAGSSSLDSHEVDQKVT